MSDSDSDTPLQSDETGRNSKRTETSDGDNDQELSAGVDKSREESSDGRTIELDTGFYKVKVSGDPDDSLDDIEESVEWAADRAREDFEAMDARYDNGGWRYNE